MSPVSLTFTSAKVSITSDDIADISQRLRVAPETVQRLGITSGPYTKDALLQLSAKLDPSEEEDLAQSLTEFGRSTIALWSGNLRDQYKPFDYRLFMGSGEYDSYKKLLKRDFEYLGDEDSAAALDAFQKRVSETPPGAPDALEMSQKFVLLTQRSATVARQVAAAKRDCRDWLNDKVAKARFKAGVAFTLDVSSDRAIALVVAQRGYVSVAKGETIPVLQSERHCNDPANACRLSYAGDWNGDPKALMTCTDKGCDWDITLLIDGSAVQRTMPARFTNFHPLPDGK